MFPGPTTLHLIVISSSSSTQLRITQPTAWRPFLTALLATAHWPSFLRRRLLEAGPGIPWDLGPVTDQAFDRAEAWLSGTPVHCLPFYNLGDAPLPSSSSSASTSSLSPHPSGVSSPASAFTTEAKSDDEVDSSPSPDMASNEADAPISTWMAGPSSQLEHWLFHHGFGRSAALDRKLWSCLPAGRIFPGQTAGAEIRDLLVEGVLGALRTVSPAADGI